MRNTTPSWVWHMPRAETSAAHHRRWLTITPKQLPSRVQYKPRSLSHTQRPEFGRMPGSHSTTFEGDSGSEGHSNKPTPLRQASFMPASAHVADPAVALLILDDGNFGQARIQHRCCSWYSAGLKFSITQHVNDSGVLFCCIGGHQKRKKGVSRSSSELRVQSDLGWKC